MRQILESTNTIKRIVAWRADKGKHKDADKSLASGISELFQTKSHALMTSDWFSSVRPEQSIPPRHVETTIRIGFHRHNRMVHAMHIGRDDHPPEDAIECCRYAHVTMVEHRGGVEEDFEAHDCRC